MKKSVLTLPLTLTGLVALWMLAVIFLRAFLPQLILPRWDIPAVAALCLAALTAETYLSPQADHHYVWLALLGAVNFGLLPVAAGFVIWQRGFMMAAVGAALLIFLAAVFASLRYRLASGPKATLAPVACALCLYLALQAFRGVLL